MKKILYTILAIIFTLIANAQDGSNLFNDAIVHTIEINKPSNPYLFDTVVVWHQNTMAGYPQKYDTVNIIFDGVALSNVGFRCKGRESFMQEYYKKPFKVKLSKHISDQKLDGIKEFNLHPAMGDPSQLRDKISYDLFRNEGINTVRVSFAKVYINGTYWGLYSIVETYNKPFLKTNFGNKGGNLYKANNNIGTGSPKFDWPISGQASTAEDTLALMHGMELKTNESEADHSKFIKLLDIINHTPETNFADSIVKYFNVPYFLKIIAIDFTLINTDGYLVGGDNFYIYYNTDTGKFDWIPWDYNWSMNYNDPSFNGLSSNPLFSNNVLVEKILNVPEFKTEFYQNICNFLDAQFNSSIMYARVDNLKTLIKAAVYSDTNKSFTNTDFDNNTAFTSVPFWIFNNPVPAIKQFVDDRNAYLHNEFLISGFDCTPSSAIDEMTNDNKDISIFPNPANNYFTITQNRNIENSKFIIFDQLGRIFKADYLSSDTQVIDISELPIGIYFLKINNVKSQTFKIIKINQE